MDARENAFDQVVSSDGTQIALERSGAGSPLVLVHGTGGGPSSFRLMQPLLIERHTVVAIERRGRGRSGDSTNEYAIEQEFADVAAVVDSLSEPADVFGHSFGATLALGAAPLATNLRKLILYEPAPGIPQTDPGFLERLGDLLSQGRREDLLNAFMVEFAGLSPADLEQFRASPMWPLRVAAAHTIPRELRAEETCALDPDAFASLSIPAMLVLGTKSPPWATRGTEAVHSLLPNSHVVSLEGQGHAATLTAPDQLAQQILDFVSEP